ncbi:MAG: hypothetical protein CUN57_02190 [Phototrophicales bacterium]|nr:MAG: hypothetical protein CUN57_02190 [Phototrophicales bacterium]
MSKDSKDFIQKCLVVNPTERPSAKECLAHPWLTGNASENVLATMKSFKSKMKTYYDKRRGGNRGYKSMEKK